MSSQVVPDLPLEEVCVVPQEPVVKPKAVGDSRLRRIAVPQRPVPRMKLMDPSPGITVHVGRIVPGPVVHHSPSHKLSAGIMGISVIVEKVGHGKAAHRDAVPYQRPLSGELILRARNPFFLRSESEIVCDIKPGEIRFRRGSIDSGNLPVRKVGDPRNVAEAFSARHLRIEIKLCIGSEPKSKEQSGGQRNTVFRQRRQAVWPLI